MVWASPILRASKQFHGLPLLPQVKHARPLAAEVGLALTRTIFYQGLLLSMVLIPPLPAEISLQGLFAKACEPAFLASLDLRVTAYAW
eukprot:7426119-Karenia_brevis.AAC.1